MEGTEVIVHVYTISKMHYTSCLQLIQMISNIVPCVLSAPYREFYKFVNKKNNARNAFTVCQNTDIVKPLGT